MRIMGKWAYAFAVVVALSARGVADAGRWVLKTEGIHTHFEYVRDDSDFSHLSDEAPAAAPTGRPVTVVVTIHNKTAADLAYALNGQNEPRIKPGAWAKWKITGTTDNMPVFNVAFDNGRMRTIRYKLEGNSVNEFSYGKDGLDLFRVNNR